MKYTIDDLRNILIKLRSENGCPWDRVQTHESIKRSMIEEAYEAIDALDKKDDKLFANELGDLLLQVVFNARIAEERGAFDFDDILYEICTKLIERHTHVFGADKSQNPDDALKIWEKNKKAEKGLKNYSESLHDIPYSLPALIRAEKIQKKAKSSGFDWNSVDGAMDKVFEELDEMKSAINNNNPKEIEEEYGDLLFAMVNLSRFINIDAEDALTKASNKFIKRFEKMEESATADGKDFSSLSIEKKEEYWTLAKNEENSN